MKNKVAFLSTTIRLFNKQTLS